jgi:hypothetical protein
LRTTPPPPERNPTGDPLVEQAKSGSTPGETLERTDAMPGDPLADAEKGEGNYKATKDYDERTKRFLDREGNKVEGLAEDAAEALDGSEGDELRRAEDEGKSHAKR